MSDAGYKEVRWIRTLRDTPSSEPRTATAVAIVEKGIVSVSEELFDIMMLNLGFIKEVD